MIYIYKSNFIKILENHQIGIRIVKTHKKQLFFRFKIGTIKMVHNLIIVPSFLESELPVPEPWVPLFITQLTYLTQMPNDPPPPYPSTILRS